MNCNCKDDCFLVKDFEKENAELRKEISVLLSCKNCPENKGGLLCQKEYEDKCLAQKIEYIKELQQENEELKNAVQNNLNQLIEQVKENAELKDKNKALDKDLFEAEKCIHWLGVKDEQLTKAKEIISELLSWERRADYDYAEYDLIKDEAEQFIKE